MLLWNKMNQIACTCHSHNFTTCCWDVSTCVTRDCQAQCVQEQSKKAPPALLSNTTLKVSVQHVDGHTNACFSASITVNSLLWCYLLNQKTLLLSESTQLGSCHVPLFNAVILVWYILLKNNVTTSVIKVVVKLAWLILQGSVCPLTLRFANVSLVAKLKG